jgi:sulfite exporter TauE/SafE
MCGPIAMMLPVAHANQTRKALQIITYHLGRLFAYGFFGLLFGFLGKGFFIAGFQQNFSIFIGFCIIVFVLIPEKKIANYTFSRPIYKLIAAAKQKLGKHFKDKTFKSFFIIGVLNGFLPCGMVYVALFGALAMQSPEYGILYMLLFGLGTIPMMSAVVYSTVFLSIKSRNKIQKVIPYLAIAIGLLFILRGLGLGIPYVSPYTMSLFVQENPNCH